MAPLVRGVVWLAAGLLAGLQRSVPDGSGPFLVSVAVAGACAALRITRPAAPVARPVDRAVLALLALAGVLLGLTARAAGERSCRQWLPAGVPLELHASVVDVAIGSDGAVRTTFAAERVTLGAVSLACRGELPGRMNGGAVPARGAGVVALGRWWSPPGARSALRRPGILMVDSVAVRAAAVPPHPTDRFRRRLQRRIDALYPRHAPLVASLLLARREGLDREVRETYARAGLSHLLAISGLHVGLVAGILVLLAGVFRAGKGPAAVVAAGGTVAYVLFLGAPHSASRAALQVVLLLVARAVQRPTRSQALVAAAALALLALDPAAILEPGFQLSFAGVAGILGLRRPLLARFERLRSLRLGRLAPGRWLADGLATSLAATVATAPIVAWHFGRVAPIGVLANLAAIPLLGAAVPALALSIAADAVAEPAGRFIAGGAALVLDALARTAAGAAAIPGGAVAVPASTAALLTGAAAGGWLVSRRLGRVRARVRGLAWGGVGIAVLLAAPVRPTVDRVEIHMIDVGQGDAIALRSPAGRWILVDAGVATDRFDAGAARVVPYLGRRGVRRLEGLVLTHPDADHTGGAAAVIAALRPRWVGDPGTAAGKTSYLEILQGAAARGISWVGLGRGMELDVDGMRLAFLFPEAPGATAENANDVSVVLRLEYGEFAALLTGDAPAAVETALVDRYGHRLDADVLKVGHHGSATSTTGALLESTGARHALISAGRGNRYGHPHPSVLARLARHGVRVHRTDAHGTVVVRGGSDGRVEVVDGRAGRRF